MITVKSKRTYESREARYMAHMIGVMSKCVMNNYDMNKIGSIDIGVTGYIGKHNITITWYDFFSKYVKQRSED